MKKRKKSVASQFWMNQNPYDVLADYDQRFTDPKKNSHFLYKLASHRRAIGNFVRILSGKNIPVVFRTDDKSYTDNKHVVIGSNIIKPKDFDVAVGVALHEASHILLTDFVMFKGMTELDYAIKTRLKKGEDINYMFQKAEARGFSLRLAFKDLVNIIEDRRIDSYVYRSAPGYREYYLSMYDKYFNSELIDKGMQSAEKTGEDYDSYLFRIINLHSDYSNPNALKHLKRISDLIDLPNIDRYKNTGQVADTAMEIIRILLEVIPEAEQQSDQQKQQQQKSNDQEPGQDGSGSASGESDDSSDGSDASDGDEGDSDSSDSKSGNDKSFKPSKKLTKKEKKQLEKLFDEQRKFIEGDKNSNVEQNKDSLSDTDASTLAGIEESETNMVSVGDYKLGKTECIVVRNFTKALITNSISPIATRSPNSSNVELIEKGFRLGKQLVNKIKTRSEERETVYNRQKNGRIDRRMLSSLGYGYESVFYNTEVDKYKKANVHISLDLSYSMDGQRFDRALVNAVAMAVAFDQIPNIDIQISFRSVMSTGSYDSVPYVLIGYDSRKDKISKIKTMFPHLHCNGTTPEGLCFQAIQNEIVASAKGIDSYFVNISDGEPWYTNTKIDYSGENAAKHTKGEVDKMRGKGINLLSYYVGSDGNKRIFTTCYGKDASFIDVENMSLVAKTVNGLLMKK